MFKMFKRKSVALANPLQDKAAGWFVAKVLWLQNKWAFYMDRRVNKLSVRSKKFGLMVFVGLSLLICMSIVIETFTGSNKSSSLKIGKMRKQPLVEEVRVSSSISERDYKRIVAFHHYMDSISVSEPRKFDSINRCRPGLLDSAKEIEKLYHSNK
jgi:hypothetical protein